VNAPRKPTPSTTRTARRLHADQQTEEQRAANVDRERDVRRVVRLEVVAGVEIEQVPSQRTGSTGNRDRDRESYGHVTSYELS